MFFVDTNILVYARDDADPWKRDRARELMAILWKTARGRLSHQVLLLPSTPP
jgi:predicted nucleic acid-binding protein